MHLWAMAQGPMNTPCPQCKAPGHVPCGAHPGSPVSSEPTPTFPGQLFSGGRGELFWPASLHFVRHPQSFRGVDSEMC